MASHLKGDQHTSIHQCWQDWGAAQPTPCSLHTTAHLLCRCPSLDGRHTTVEQLMFRGRGQAWRGPSCSTPWPGYQREEGSTAPMTGWSTRQSCNSILPHHLLGSSHIRRKTISWQALQGEPLPCYPMQSPGARSFLDWVGLQGPLPISILMQPVRQTARANHSWLCSDAKAVKPDAGADQSWLIWVQETRQIPYRSARAVSPIVRAHLSRSHMGEPTAVSPSARPCWGYMDRTVPDG